jgi:hypothetical protein
MNWCWYPSRFFSFILGRLSAVWVWSFCEGCFRCGKTLEAEWRVDRENIFMVNRHLMIHIQGMRYEGRETEQITQGSKRDYKLNIFWSRLFESFTFKQFNCIDQKNQKHISKRNPDQKRKRACALKKSMCTTKWQGSSYRKKKDMARRRRAG